MDKKHCSGCEDDFYNGNNPYGVKLCWHLDTAKPIKRKQVHINQRPPWNQEAKTFPSCYRQNGYVFVHKDQKY